MILKNKTLRIAFIGPGGVGKTTVIFYLKDFFEENSMAIFDERKDMLDEYEEYTADMKNWAYKMQKMFFAKRLIQIKELCKLNKGVIDRHLIDDFIYPHVHRKINNFNKTQTTQWEELEKHYWNELEKLPKLDLVILLMADEKDISNRRDLRAIKNEKRKNEQANEKFFKEAIKLYNDKDSIMYKAFKFAKNSLIINNEDSKETAIIIKNKLLEMN